MACCAHLTSSVQLSAAWHALLSVGVWIWGTTERKSNVEWFFRSLLAFLLENCSEGVRFFTVFCFCKEDWKRPCVWSLWNNQCQRGAAQKKTERKLIKQPGWSLLHQTHLTLSLPLRFNYQFLLLFTAIFHFIGSSFIAVIHRWIFTLLLFK